MPAGRPKALDPQTAMPIILRLFWHDGYGGVTLDQVAAQLGVTKPTLCRALGEKEAVDAAALGAYHEAFIAPAEAHFNGATTLRDALAGAFAVFVDRVLDEHLPAGCFLGDSSMVGGFGTGLIAETIDALRGSLAAAVQQRVRGALEDGELEPASSVQPVVAYILGQISALSAISRSRPSRSEVDAVVGYMLAGLPWTTRRSGLPAQTEGFHDGMVSAPLTNWAAGRPVTPTDQGATAALRR